MTTTPAGYTYDEQSATSPVTREQLSQLLTDVMWTDDDAAALRRAGEFLRPPVSDQLGGWYDFIGSTPHLVAVFHGTDGEPDAEYLDRVRGRFEQWVVDLCTREFDGQWLAYQEEIALRHHPTKKNQTDGVDSPWSHVPMSHMMALAVPVTLTVRDFLAKGESDPSQLDAMHQAWFKAVTVTLVLWSRPYAGDLW